MRLPVSTQHISVDSFEVTITAMQLNAFMFLISMVSQVFLANKVLSTDRTVKPGLILAVFGLDVSPKGAGVFCFKITKAALFGLFSM